MAAITIRNGRFQARVRKDGFRPVSKTFAKKADAVAWSRRVEVEMETGRWVDETQTVPTLNEAIQTYRAGRGGSLKGSQTYSYWWDEVGLSWLGSINLQAISPAHLAKWRDEQIARGLKPGTVCRKLGLLSGLFTWAVKDKGWLVENPLTRVRKPAVRDNRDRLVNDQEMGFLRRAAETSRVPWIADAICVLGRSAVRRSELWGLRIKDIDFEASTAYLADTKNGFSRHVTLDTQAREALGRLVVAARARVEAERRRAEIISKYAGRMHPAIGSATVPDAGVSTDTGCDGVDAGDDAGDDALRALFRPWSAYTFATDDDRGAMLAAVMTAVCRPVLPIGPGFFFDAAVQASGKTRAAGSLGCVMCGQRGGSSALRLGWEPRS